MRGEGVVVTDSALLVKLDCWFDTWLIFGNLDAWDNFFGKRSYRTANMISWDSLEQAWGNLG